MRKVILYIACSLDGYIARPSGEIDWLSRYENAPGEDYGYGDLMARIDTVLMGRRTYDQVLTFGAYPYPDKEGLVFSRSRAGTCDENVCFAGGDPAKLVRSLKAEPGKEIWIVGGAQLIRPLLDDDLIDEFVVTIVPVLLGEGILLFRGPFAQLELRLQSSRAFDNGLVQLVYTRDRPGASEAA
jgi:dihydrofolate reductase